MGVVGAIPVEVGYCGKNGCGVEVAGVEVEAAEVEAVVAARAVTRTVEGQ